MKQIKLLTLALMFSSNFVFGQSTLEYVEEFLDNVFKQNKTRVLVIDSMKIQQSDTIYKDLDSPVRLSFSKEIFVLEDFSFSTQSIEKGTINEFQRGETGVYGETDPYYFRSTIYLDNDFVNDIFELSLTFDDLSTQNNRYHLKLMNTGFDFYFKGSFQIDIDTE